MKTTNQKNLVIALVVSTMMIASPAFAQNKTSNKDKTFGEFIKEKLSIFAKKKNSIKKKHKIVIFKKDDKQETKVQTQTQNTGIIKQEQQIVIKETENTTKNDNTSTQSNSAYAEVVAEANKYMGTPYVYGGMSEKGMDCSGLTTLAYLKAGVKLPRSSKAQSSFGEAVKMKDLQVGDLVFFSNHTPGVVGHVGMVVDASDPNDIKFINATVNRGVTVSSLASPHWKKLYINARRVNLKIS